jgi:hypothetical protein
LPTYRSLLAPQRTASAPGNRGNSGGLLECGRGEVAWPGVAPETLLQQALEAVERRIDHRAADLPGGLSGEEGAGSRELLGGAEKKKK